jgi:ABC-type Fe3+ transport system permease subunit/sugar lactone lactonase YvrE
MNGLLLLQSLGLGVLVTLAAFCLGWTVAIAAMGSGDRERKVWRGVAVAALALPPFWLANSWLELLSSVRLSIPKEAWDGWAFLATAGILTSMLWPIVTLSAWAAWGRLQAAHLEADPGVRGFRLFRGVLLPMGRSEWRIAATVVFVLAVANFTVPVLFQVRVFTEAFWIRFNTQFDTAGAMAVGWPLWVLPFVCVLFWRRGSWAWPRVELATPPAVWRHALGGWAWASRFVAGLGLVVTIGIPMAGWVASGRTWTELPGAAAAGGGAMVNSLWTAVVPATSGVVLTLVLHGLGLRPSRWLWWPFLVPGIVLAVVLVRGIHQPFVPDVLRGWGTVWLALGLRYLALSWFLVEAALTGADPSWSEAARSVGAGRWQAFWKVELPQILPHLGVAWYAVYVLCLWDVETIVLLQPPGGETLALRIFNLLHYGHAAQVNALCGIMVGLAAAPLLVWGILRRWLVFGMPGSQLAVLALAVIGLAGCGDPAPTSNSRSLESRLFSRVESIGSRGVAPGQFNKPRSLVCDRQDRLFVADFTGRIQRFSPDGRFELQWQMPETELGKPKGMGLDRDGDIVVVEPHYMRVNHFTPEGLLVSRWGTRGTSEGEFILPRAVVQDAAGCFLLSEYTVVDRIQRFRPEVKDLGRFPSPIPSPFRASPSPDVRRLLDRVWGTPGSGPGQLNRAEGLAVDAQDHLWVADSCNHRVEVFDREGNRIRTLGRAGTGPGDFSYPYDVKIDAAGRVFVCEFGNSRITVLDSTGQVIEVVGGAGGALGQFANPWAITLDSRGNLYVADAQNHRVQKLVRR